MQPAETIAYARKLLDEYKVEDNYLAELNFLDFAEIVRDIVKDLTPKQKAALKNFKDFSESFRKLRDNFENEVKADPMILYKPKHQVALEFHQSLAQVRNFFGGNRISKTQAGAADNYWVLTNQHPWRPRPPLPSSVFIIGSNFSKYAPNVFEKKYLTGEPGNPLSPIFPPGGRWFNRYDERKHIIYLACPECSKAGRALQCRHIKSTLTLFSDVEGPGVLAGGQYAQGQFDEQIRPEFFAEAKQRITTVPNSGLVITETPLYGKAWWTYKDVYLLGKDDSGRNRIIGTDRPIVSNHTINQYDAGLVPHEVIEANKMSMTEPEIRARIYGEYVAASENAVFDLVVLSEMSDDTLEPVRGHLKIKGEKERTKTHTVHALLEQYEHTPDNPLDIRFVSSPSGNLRVWKRPSSNHQYIIGADVSEGMTKGDPSCAQVLRMEPYGFAIKFTQVASYHGWINSHVYAEELYKLGAWYNNATVVVENNGPGVATLQRLKELGCWFVFREVSDPAAVNFTLDPSLGVNTNIRSKGMMISILQNLVRERKLGKKTLSLVDAATIEEMESYVQTLTESKLSYRFGAAGQSNDDRVMALALAVYVGTSYPIYDPEMTQKERYENLDEHSRQFWDGLRVELEEQPEPDVHGF